MPQSTKPKVARIEMGMSEDSYNRLVAIQESEGMSMPEVIKNAFMLFEIAVKMSNSSKLGEMFLVLKDADGSTLEERQVFKHELDA